MRFVYCCACSQRIEKNRATTVPKSEERRKVWIGIFGDEFRRMCNFYKVPYICVAHFENSKRTRSNLPLKKPPRDPFLEELPHWVWSCKEVEETMDFENASEEQIDDLMEVYEPSNEVESVDELSTSDDFTTEKFDYKYFLCKTEKVVKLLKRCRKCATKNTEMDLKFEGMTMTIKVKCEECGNVWRWENCDICSSNTHNSKQKLREINLDTVSSVFLSGNGFQSIKGLFNVLNAPLISDRSYRRLKKRYVYPAVEEYYEKQMIWVTENVENVIERGELLNICGDGSYDSRGHSALYCRYIFMTCDSHLVIDSEIMHKRATEKNSQMEVKAFEKGFRRIMEKFKDKDGNSTIFSFTSDRSKCISKVMSDKFPTVEHYFDAWHFIRQFALEFMKKMKQKQFEPLVKWFRSFVNQIYYAVHESDGDGVLARERLLSFFPHILNVHKNFADNKDFSFLKLERITECSHYDIDPEDEGHADYLSLENKSHVKALNCLLTMLKKGDRLKAIEKVSPHLATSSIESFNARACFYAPKDRYYPEHTFEILNKMAAIDWNDKKKDEMEGKRVITGEKKFFNKTTKSYSTRYTKTPSDYKWRRDIRDIVTKNRAEEQPAVDEKKTVMLDEEDDDSDYDEHDMEFDAVYDEKSLDALWDSLETCSDNDEDELEKNGEEEIQGKTD